MVYSFEADSGYDPVAMGDDGSSMGDFSPSSSAHLIEMAAFNFTGPTVSDIVVCGTDNTDNIDPRILNDSYHLQEEPLFAQGSQAIESSFVVGDEGVAGTDDNGSTCRAYMPDGDLMSSFNAEEYHGWMQPVNPPPPETIDITDDGFVPQQYPETVDLTGTDLHFDYSGNASGEPSYAPTPAQGGQDMHNIVDLDASEQVIPSLGLNVTDVPPKHETRTNGLYAQCRFPTCHLWLKVQKVKGYSNFYRHEKKHKGETLSCWYPTCFVLFARTDARSRHWKAQHE